MRLEQRLSSVQFHEDATHAPQVARVGPPKPENDLWRAVVARGYDGGVVLRLEGGAAEVDQFDGLFVVRVDEQNVLRFQVRVDEGETVYETYALQELEGVGPDFVDGKGLEAVLPELLVQRGP